MKHIEPGELNAKADLHEIPPAPKPPTSLERFRQIKALANDGLTVAQVARQLEIKPHQILLIAKKHGFTFPRGGGRRRFVVTSVPVAVLNAVAARAKELGLSNAEMMGRILTAVVTKRHTADLDRDLGKLGKPKRPYRRRR